MTALQPDSFDVSSMARQSNSKKETMPAHSFGTASREASAKKVFISKRHEDRKGIMISPGPVYSPPTGIGTGSKYGFGTDEQRKHPKAKYPDSSVDLTCAAVESQGVKFHSTKGIHFGTESRLHSKNAEIIRVHPASALGMESPGALEYSPKEIQVATKNPEYSFGPVQPPQTSGKVVPRIPLPLTGAPRTLGPGSHSMPDGLSTQPQSARATAPSWSFGSASRQGPTQEPRQLLDTSPELSSLGRQVVSSARSAPRCRFGSSTRDQVARTTLVQTASDRGPAAQMPKPNFHVDLPPPTKNISKPGF